MCDPISIGLAGVALGSKVAGGIAANKAARKQREATIASANRSYGDQVADINARAGEETSAAQLSGQNIREMSLAELGLADASAADSNVSGATVDAGRSELARRASIASDVNTSNLDSVLAQLSRTARGAASERDSRINGAPQERSNLLDTLGFATQLAIPHLPGIKGSGDKLNDPTSITVLGAND